MFAHLALALLLVVGVASAIVPPTVRIKAFPPFNPTYSCPSCPCAAFDAVSSATVSGDITWDALDSPTNYKIALYILGTDMWWWAKPTFTNRYASVLADGTWSTPLYSHCFDPKAFEIVAFVVPVAADPDTLQDGRTCGCATGGANTTFGYNCLPPAQQGYASHSVLRGLTEPYFAWSGYILQKKSCTSACGPGSHLFNPAGVTVTTGGALQLSIKKYGTIWQSAEATFQHILGYGTYLFQVI